MQGVSPRSCWPACPLGLCCRTVRRWCGELALSGRLLFLGGLILAVLEGPPEDVKECLAYWRTRSVDVDSKGRCGLAPSWEVACMVGCGGRSGWLVALLGGLFERTVKEKSKCV